MSRWLAFSLLVLLSSLAFPDRVEGDDAGASSARPAAARLPVFDTLPGSTYLPKWLTFGVQLRARVESPQGIGFKSDVGDSYYLNRFRVEAAVKPVSWLRLFAQAQDTRTLGYGQGTPPASLRDPWDLRQGYIEVGGGESRGLLLRLGRQELNYGGGWLASAADWGNTARVFDAAVATLYRRHIKLDLFASSVVQADSQRFDRHKPGEHFYGSYGTLDRLVHNQKIEPFLLLKTQWGMVGERGDRGNLHNYSGGVRLTGKLPLRFDYTALLVKQWGYWASDRISAGGGNYIVGWTVSENAWKPRLSFEYDYASGDRGGRDGERNTFDQLYGAFHYFLGTCDRLGWRNSRNMRGGMDFVPHHNWKVIVDVRNLSLATVSDGLYDYSGTRNVFNPNATSAHVGVEVDTYFIWQATRKTAIGGGVGHLLPGAYLKQSTAGAAYTFPYLMLNKVL